MKKIQPFTIGTKLSVPIGAKCQDYVDNIFPAAVLDGCMLKSNRKDKMSFSHDQKQPTKHDPTPMEDCPEEEKGFLHPSASSRSIRKIAMCGSTETEGEFGVVDPCITTYEPNQRHNSSEKPLEGRFVDKSLPHSESEPWRERKMKNLQYDNGIPAFPLEHPEDVSASQQQDLKDFENSLIQLTTYLDLKKDEPEGSALKKPNTTGLGVEILGRRLSIGEHIDKLWLKFRSLLQDFQQDLMLALDVSSFYQQADQRSSLHVANVQGSIKENEGREIASQIKMLNESAAQLSNLHPTLASQVTCKQAEVKESWALLQDALRNQIADVPVKPPAILPKGHVGSQTTSTESKYLAQLELPGVMGKDVKEEQNHLRESECCQDPWIYRMLSPTEECCSMSRTSLSEGSCCKVDNTNEKQIMGSESKDQQALSDSFIHQKPLKLYELLADSTASVDQLTCSWLKDNTSMQSGVDRGYLKQSQEHASTKIEVLWEGLRKRYGHGAEVEPAEKEFLLTDDVAERAVLKLPHSSCPPENVDVYSSGMLAKFLQLLDHKAIHEMHKDIPALQNGSTVSECNEALPYVPGSPNVRGWFFNHDQTKEELLNMQLSTLTLRINQHLSRCAELSMDMLDMETDMTMLCDPELIGLDGLLEEQDDLEVDYHLIEGEVEGMEILVKHLQVPLTEQSNLTEEVQSVQQAWEEAGHNLAENREHLEKFKQLRDYFENYLATIAWTESTRSCILSGSAALHSEAAEMDRGIEQKLLEFDKLATAGQTLMEEGNYLAEIIKERTDELKSMLGWIQVNWKTQREQSQRKNIFEKVDPVNDSCIIEREEMRNNEGNQHSQNQKVTNGVESLLDQQNIRSDDPALVIQEPCSAQTSLGSSICLILSYGAQSSGIRQVCKEISPSSSEVYMQQLPRNNKIHCHQSLVSNSVTTQRLPDINQVQNLQCNETVISEGTEQKKKNCINMQVQQSQGNHLTNRQQSIKPKHTQPSLPVLPVQQSDVINQELKQQPLDNIQKQRQQSPTNDEERWQLHEKQWQQSPRIIQIQQNQITLQAPVNNKEQGTEQKERAESSPSNSLHHQQQKSSTTQVYQQSSNNIQAFDDSGNYLAEKQQLIGNDQINLSSPQKADQSQNYLIVVNQDIRQKLSSISEQCSAQLSLKFPDKNQVKDQQSAGIKQVQKQKSPSNSQTHIPLEQVGAAEVMHRVSTYLHVTDRLKAADEPSEMFSTSGPLFSRCSSSSLYHQALSGFVTAHSSATTRSSFAAPLKQQMKRKESNQRRHTTIGAVRSDNSSMTQSSISPCSFRERANTWPEGDEHGKKHQTNSEHQVFIKKHSISAIYTDESNPVNILRDNFQTMSAVPRDPIKNICSYLSLGSTLSFSLPQDFMLLNGRDADLQSSEEHPPSTPVLIGSNNQPSPAALPVGSSNLTLNQIPQLALEVQPTLTLQGKSNHETIYVLDKLILDASDKTEKQQHDTHAQGTMVSTKEFCHWEMGKEQDMGQHTSREQSSEFKEALTVVGHIPTTTSSSSTGPSHSHKCLSVHSRIMDLNGHIYHASRYMQWTWKTNSVLLEIKHKPNQLPDSKLGSNKSNRVVFCGERECTVCCSGLEEQSPAAPITEDGVEVPQPSHWQFQEEEEELDDIWRRKVDDVASDWAVERKEVRRQMAYSSHRVHFAESRKEEERLLLVPSYSYPYHKTDLGSASSVSSPLPVIGRSQNCN